ncbi:GNAT family N-acetyltransferase [Actinacidiphila reveromycinica]|nr:GNAT family N-acetyltransferase [Streptomyces sp. SN-593]
MPHSTSAASAPARRRHRGRHLTLAAVLPAALAAAFMAAGPAGGAAPTVSAAVLATVAAGLLWHRGRGTARRSPRTGACAGGSTGTTGITGGGAAPAEAPSPAAEGTGTGTGTTLWRLRTTVRDTPGTLGAVCTALADRRIDIVSLQTHPLADGTVDEFLLRAPSGLPATALEAAVEGAGGADTWLERADAHDLVDMPTRVLGLATRTALDAAELPLALRRLLGRCTIGSTPAGQPGQPEELGGGAREEPYGHGPLQEADASGGTPEALPTVMRLRDPAGGLITVRRAQPPFTPTEFARARALVELDALLGTRVPRRRDVLTVPQGSEIGLRRARPEDRPAARSMHARCTPATLARRYHGPVGDADRYLTHLLDPRFGQSLAVETPDGRVVGLGHLLWDGDESEVALLVEDAWQRRGVGTTLLRRLVELAADAGRESVYAVAQSANTGMVAAMRALELPLDYQVEDGTLVITAALPTASGGGPAALPWTVSDRPA